MSNSALASVGWDEFVHSCATAFDKGMSDASFSEGLAGRRVRWIGKVARLDLNRGTTIPGIAITMPWIEIALKSERTLVGSYLFLKLNGTRVDQARQKRVGDTITFGGSFSQPGVFSSVHFDVDDEQNKVFVSMTLEDGEALG